MNKQFWLSVIGFGITFFAFSAVSAQEETRDEPKYEIRLGSAGAFFDAGVDDPLVGGAPISGADASVSDAYTLLFEFNYFLRNDISLSLTGGIPPESKVDGKGSLIPFGEIAEVTFGPSVFTLRKHFRMAKDFVPYIGLGASYVFVLDTNDGSVNDFEADDAFGPVIVIGVDGTISERIGWFFDVKKIYVSSDANFSVPTPFGEVPGEGELQLDPLVVSAGLSYRF